MESGRSVLIIAGLGNPVRGIGNHCGRQVILNTGGSNKMNGDRPRCDDRTQNIDTTISTAQTPVVLVAHSMGYTAWIKKGLQSLLNQ